MNPIALLIAGVSTRAAAESAARAGFAVVAIDAFGDRDQHASVRSISLGRDFSAHAAARAGRSIECDAVVYLSNFENHPKAIGALAGGRALWGNPPEIIRRVRDPVLLSEALRRRGFAVPEVRLKPDTTDVNETPEQRVVSGFSRTVNESDGSVVSGFSRTVNESDGSVVSGFSRTVAERRWLVKPFASGGGLRIRPWDRALSVPPGCHLQECLDGPSGSVVFVAAGGRAVPLAVCRQLVGEEGFGASGYQYCGNILVAADDPWIAAASLLAGAVAEEFGLVGVNGIDFVSRGGVPHAIEVNPRWCASMELVELAHGFSVFGAHAESCTSGVLPEFDFTRVGRGAFGKAVVYARHHVVVGDTRPWLDDTDVRDVPHQGTQIPAGRPVCTVFAAGHDAATCHDALLRRAERVYSQLAAWERVVQR